VAIGDTEQPGNEVKAEYTADEESVAERTSLCSCGKLRSHLLLMALDGQESYMDHVEIFTKSPVPY
jgi:hypothetical protein